jgi:hypothetical protein
MKRLLIGVFICVTVIAMTGVASVSAMPTEKIPGLKGMVGPAGNSNNGFVELWEKAPSGEWPIIEDGAWAKMRYSLTGETFDFHFNAHGLEPEVSYSLIYYPDPWPGNGLIVLGEGTPNEEGHLLIKGSAEIEVLPGEGDENATPGEEGEEVEVGAKIWLVLTADIGEGAMAGWTPSEYLFEYALITFNAPDPDTAYGESAATDNHSKPDKPDKPDKPEKSNNGKGNNK